MLWTKQDHEEYAKKMNLSKDEAEKLENRRTGKSTEIAFRTFAEVYRSRGQWIEIRDHYGTSAADRHLSITMQDMAKALGFEFEWRQIHSKYCVRLNK